MPFQRERGPTDAEEKHEFIEVIRLFCCQIVGNLDNFIHQGRRQVPRSGAAEGPFLKGV